MCTYEGVFLSERMYVWGSVCVCDYVCVRENVSVEESVCV